MNKERLRTLAALLEADAANPKGVKFDLGLWGFREKLREKSMPKTVRVECGTVACAIGLACISGVFKDEGFTAYLMKKYDCGGNNILPTFKGLEGFNAVTAFFDITSDTACRLFEYQSYPMEQQRGKAGELAVAGAIRELIDAPQNGD